MANFTGKIIGVGKTSVKLLNGLQPTQTYSLRLVNSKPYLPGFAWETPSTIPAGSWRAITYGSGKFVAVSQDVGSTTSVMTSSNGLTWTSQTTPPGAGWYDITYGGLFVAVGILGASTTQRIMTSHNGITWTLQTHTACQPISIAYGNGVYVAVTQSASPKIIISSDGITWNDYNPVNLTAGLIGKVRFVNGFFVCSPSSPSANIAYSTDGITWTLASTTYTGSWNGIAFNSFGNQYMLTSSFSALKVYSSSLAGPYTFADPFNPSRLSSLVTATISGVYVGSDARTSVGTGQRISTSSDGYNWTLRSGINVAVPIQSLAYGDNRLVAVGTNYVAVSY